MILLISLLPEKQRIPLCARTLKFWSRAMLRIFRVRVNERPAFDDAATSGARVIVANHVSYLDIPVLLARGPCLFVAKKEVADWPLIGWIARRTGHVFVDRGSLWSRARALLELQTRLQQGINIVIFPEGSTSIEGPRRGLTNFFAGAFRIARMESMPVEMLYLDYSDSERCAFVGDDSFLPHVWNVYARGGTTVTIRSEIIHNVHNRRHQRAAHGFCRNWLLEGGRNFRGLTPAPEFGAR